MAKSSHVGFRLHPVHDKDIIDDVEKYKNATARWKEVYRFMLAHQVAIPSAAPITSVADVPAAPKPQPKPQPIPRWTVPPKDGPAEPLDWSQTFTQAPVVANEPTKKRTPDMAHVRNTIMSDF